MIAAYEYACQELKAVYISIGTCIRIAHALHLDQRSADLKDGALHLNLSRSRGCWRLEHLVGSLGIGMMSRKRARRNLLLVNDLTDKSTEWWPKSSWLSSPKLKRCPLPNSLHRVVSCHETLDLVKNSVVE